MELRPGDLCEVVTKQWTPASSTDGDFIPLMPGELFLVQEVHQNTDASLSSKILGLYRGKVVKVYGLSFDTRLHRLQQISDS